MSAIQSLLRVMVHRDAEAIILEANKVPSLRRRGAVETLAMAALEPTLIADFIAPLLAGRSLDAGSVSAPFVDTDGTAYDIKIEKVASGARLIVRKGKPAAPPPAPAAAPPSGGSAWWAKPSPSTTAAPVAPAAAPSTVPSVVSGEVSDAARALLAHLLEQPVALAAQREASDVLVSTGQPVRIRVDGRFERTDLSVEDGELAACVAAVGNNADLSLSTGGARVRVNAFEHFNGAGIAARLIRDQVPSLSALDLPPELASIIEQRDGLVIVCGPTGSGKSTTLAALVQVLDARRAAHVITLEDPIEYRFQPERCIVHQREVGTHIPTFAAGLKAALREAPDVIVLGEMRDKETIAAALTAAETGHLVLATLHAPGAAGAIDRIIDAFPEGQQRQVRWQLASSLRTVVTQYLLPRRDGGRAVAVELCPITAAVANIMRKGDLHMLPSAIQTGRDIGMIPLERSLARLLDSGQVSPQSVKRIAADHDLLAALASKLR
ncbi:MAG TPA: PilT/PilU family type 4a pilus ATPase [Kofleriaceae bacterium]|jgi:twitching motility protein PilT